MTFEINSVRINVLLIKHLHIFLNINTVEVKTNTNEKPRISTRNL